jgi:hypothetical protein
MMLKIKENNGTINIISSLNKIRSEPESKFGDKSLKTQYGTICIDEGVEMLETIENKLKYPNIKKLILYLCYRLTKENELSIEVNINEFLSLKGQKRQSNLTQTLIEDLKVLEKIQISNFRAHVKKREVFKSRNHSILKVEDWEEIKGGYINYISVRLGQWAETMIDVDQFAFIPSEIFSFSKLEFDIAFNILMRLRYQQHKKMREKETTKFNLSVKYLLKGVDIPVVDKYGPTKVIEKIERVLNKLQSLNWFKWHYRENIYSLPGRNIFKEYKKFMLIFDINNSILGKAYNLNKVEELKLVE